MKTNKGTIVAVIAAEQHDTVDAPTPTSLLKRAEADARSVQKISADVLTVR